MSIYKIIDSFFASLSGLLWGTPLVLLLLGGGIFFAIYSRLTPLMYFKHGIDILLGKYDSKDDPGQITHFEALSSALAGTVGMGNIAGVAVAIYSGGPGAIFWMWVTAILGMTTKFFTCTLAVMYRGIDDKGQIQGGVMYFIEEGLGKNYKPLSLMFSISGLFGSLVFFQANQLSQIIRDFVYAPLSIFQNNIFIGNFFTGILVAMLVGIVIFGGIKRIAKVSSRMVPFMVGLYIFTAIIILFKNFGEIPGVFKIIFQNAFNGDAIAGGTLGSIIIIGVRRGLFSNEAGTGTETMAHGAAKTKEPVREGLVAMLGPFIDTILVCTITALIILTSGVWNSGFESSIKSINPTTQRLKIETSRLDEMKEPNNSWLDYSFKTSFLNQTTHFVNQKSSKVTMYSILNKLLGNAGENGEYFEYIKNPVQREAYLKAVEQGKLNDWKESVGFTKKMVGNPETVEFKIDSIISATELIVYTENKNVSFTYGLIAIQKSDTTYQFPLFLEQKQYFKAQISGVTLTTLAFEKELGLLGRIFLTIAALTFALSTMFGYSYYGRKCTSYLFGTNWKNIYNIVYIIMIIIASIVSIDIAINFVDSAYALMVIPTMIGTILLAPKVIAEAKKYFSSL